MEILHRPIMVRLKKSHVILFLSSKLSQATHLAGTIFASPNQALQSANGNGASKPAPL